MLEDLHIGATVTSSSGAHLGTLSRVVVDGTSDQVVGLVVDPGLVESGNLLAPGGWERPRERVVPTSLVLSVTQDGLRLSCDEAAFAQLPLFEREQSAEVNPSDVSASSGGQRGWSRFRVGELINYFAAEFGLGAAPYVPPTDTTPLEPPTAGAIAEGTAVWRLDPHERIGEVERVLVDGATQRVSLLVVRRGGLVRHRALLPISAISSIEDGVVHVRLSDAELEALAPFDSDA
jgi:uncharacterized protein YrrD